MYEQLVSFKTAKLAKEKGFDEYSCSWFENDESIHFASEEEDLESDQVKYKTFKKNYSDTIFLRPTQSLLQKWLREIYSIDITVIIRFADTYGIIVHQNRNLPRAFEEIITKVTYENHKNIYETSLESGLLCALELINV